MTTAQIPDSLTISIVHGYRVKKEFRKTYRALPGSGHGKSVGGLRGGHVEVHMDTVVYGFTDGPQAKIPHIFSHNKKRNNGLFQKKKLNEWKVSNQTAKITFIKIPISPKQFVQLKVNYENNIHSCPYDFALFGMRCASSAYDMLARVGLLEFRKKSKTILGIFHPRAFRKNVLPWAREKGYPIKIQEGITEKMWDK